MKVYRIEEGRVFKGINMSARSTVAPDKNKWLSLGGGSKTVEVPVFKKNLPEIDNNPHLPWGGILREAHPVRIDGGYALAKPNQPSDKILVVLKTRRQGFGKPRSGFWSFDRTVSTCDSIDQTLARATGPRDYYGDQNDAGNIGWMDALVVMKVGDVVMTVDQKGDVTVAEYKSVEEGLVKIEK